MTWRPLFLATIACATAVMLDLGGAASAKQSYRLSGPITHENLSIYFVHGASSGPQSVPLTLQEALAKGAVTVHETGNVNELVIENAGGDEVFVQAGDIVKGGQQDRVLTVSLLLPAQSGRMPIGAFCVEQGRWTARGGESATQFGSAAQAVPSRDAKLAMLAPVEPRGTEPAADSSTQQRVAQARRSETGVRQTGVWNSVATAQRKLSSNLGADVAAPQSGSSLQLSLENRKLAEARAAYVAALGAAGGKDTDIVGFVFAINGQVNSADIYGSNGLFRKMWPKLLGASATEAIGEKTGNAASAPAIETVQAFLAAAEDGKPAQRKINDRLIRESREADAGYLFETKRSAGELVHRAYLAR